MLIAAKKVQLKNGQSVILRSPGASDAKAMLAYLRQTSAETHFMARYPEEILLTVEEEMQFLENVSEDTDDFMIAAFLDDGELVGNISVQGIQELLKYRHRAGLGVSILEKVWGIGLGTVLLREALEHARNTRFEQIELGVFSDNVRAMHLYEKAGFEQVGRIPGAFRLKDGTYCDEIQMVYKLSRGEVGKYGDKR